MAPELANFLAHTRLREIGILFPGRGCRIGVKPYEGLFMCPEWPQIQTVSKDSTYAIFARGTWPAKVNPFVNSA
jgi:hypothetical protein